MAKKNKKTNPKGAGRNPVADPKKQLSLYVETSIIKANGGKEEAQRAAYSFLKKEARKKTEAKSVEE